MTTKLLRSVFMLIVCACFTTNMAWAQNGTLKGHITDQNSGQVLISANVYVSSLARGTTTGTDGTFTLENVPYGTYELRVTYIGYQTKMVTVTVDQSVENVEIKLKSAVGQLEELVVTGLASSIKRQNLANSVASVSAEELTGNSAPQTVSSALQGKVAGIDISTYSGAPGGGFNIQLRGVSTLGAGSSQPLIIIDGIYMSNAAPTSGRSILTGASGTDEDNVANMLAGINPEDIESIEVLKGPSAAAIYGQRANAGVVIITTKGGVAGETRISVSQDIGFSEASKFLGRAQWNDERIIAAYDDESIPGLSAKAQLELDRYHTAKSNGMIRDLEKELYGNKGLINNTQISIAGGNEKTRFYVAGNYSRDEGIIETTYSDRKSLRANIDHDISESIHISSNSSYIHRESDRGFTNNQNGSGGSIGYSLAYTPNYAYGLLQPNAEGIYPDNPYFGENMFRLMHKAVNDNNTDRFLQSVAVNIDLINDGPSILSFSAKGGLDYFTNKALIYFPNFMQAQKNAALPGEVVHTNHESLNINMQAILKFNTTLKPEIGDLFLGTQLGATRYDHTTKLDRIYGQGLLPGQTNVGNASVVEVNQFFTDVTDIGFFGQQTINWDDKIIATVGVRLDRSTLNLQQNEYYFYPKASLALRLPNFDFWTTDIFDQFKLRVAYGETGGLPSYGTTFLLLGNTNIDGTVGTTAPNTSVDPNLKPERAQGLEFGIDLAFFDNRLSFSGTRYIKTVEDLILGLEPAPSTAVNNILTNAATLKNKGIELSLEVIPIQTDKLSWNATFLWWKNESVITKLKIPPKYDGIYFGATRYEVGVSPTALYGTTPDSDGRVKLGNFQPDYQMSWLNQITFSGNWELSFLWKLSQGGELINLSKYLSDVSKNTADYWENYPELPERFSQGTATTRFLEDASFLKLKQLSLYYTLPSSFINQAFGEAVRNIKIGVSGSNLLTIDNYTGYDPSVNVSGRTSLSTSVSIVPYPPSRQFLFHIDLEF